MSPHAHRLMRMISSRSNDIEEWRLGNVSLAAAKGYPRPFEAEIIDDWGIVFLDLTLDADSGEIACHEVNGPNGVGSDALTGDSESRARNEAAQTVRRLREFGLLDKSGRLKAPVATVHAHQHGAFFRTGGEFFPRVARYAEAIEALLPGHVVALRSANEAPGDEDIAIVLGEVPDVAARIRLDAQTRRFEYAARPLVFAGNPNLLPELTRTGRIDRGYAAALPSALRVFHAWRLAPIIHDKSLQQDLLRGTGIQPLAHFEAATRAQAIAKTRSMLRHGAVVLKPNGTSGGAGVQAVVPVMSDAAIAERVEMLIANCAAKYGANVEEMIFPLRGFAFARSTPYHMADGDRLWDLRVAVQFEPGKAVAYPVSIRLTPEPFDPARFHDHRDQWVSNVGGRTGTLLKSGMDDAVLDHIGFTPDKIELALRAAVTWTLKAWDHSVRNGGTRDVVYEDECEERDPSFYPARKAI